MNRLQKPAAGPRGQQRHTGAGGAPDPPQAPDELNWWVKEQPAAGLLETTVGERAEMWGGREGGRRIAVVAEPGLLCRVISERCSYFDYESLG